MPEGSSNKAPTTLGATIIAAAVALVASRGYDAAKPSSDDGPKAASASSTESPGSGSAASDEAETPADALTLRPLGEVIFGEKSPSLKKEPSCDWVCDVQAIRSVPTVRCLIATIPDPVNTSISFRFDESIDAIERAAANRHYALERWRYPWAERGKASDGRTALKFSPSPDGLHLTYSAPGHAAAPAPFGAGGAGLAGLSQGQSR